MLSGTTFGIEEITTFGVAEIEFVKTCLLFETIGPLGVSRTDL